MIYANPTENLTGICLEGEYLKTVPEKRKDKLRNIAKRFVKPPQTYLNLKRDFEYSAKQQNCSIYHLYDPKSDKYPEDIEW